MGQTKEQVIVELIYKQVGKDLTKDGLDNFKKNFSQTEKQFGQITEATVKDGQLMVKGMENTGKGFAKFSSGVVDYTGKMSGSVSTGFGEMRQQFNFAYLSFLFMGMAMQRTASTVMKTTTRAFMDVARSGSVAGDALIGLNAEFAYLKFSVGQAIGEAFAPLMPIVIEMVRGFSSFVQQHPEATFAAIASVLAVGGAMSMLGQLGLFLQGLSTFKVSKEWTALTGPGGGVTKLSALAQKGLGIAVAFDYAADAFDKFKEGNIIGGIGDALGTAAGAAIFMGKTDALGKIIIIKTALELVQGVFSGSAEMIKETISEAFILAGAGAITKNVGVGAAMIAIGFTLKFISIDDINNTIKYIEDKLLKPIGDKLQSITMRATGDSGMSQLGFFNLPTSSGGGRGYAVGSSYIPEDGMAMLHRGERVMTAGQSNLNMNGGINITVNTSGGVNGNALAQQIMSEIKRRTA